MESGGDGLSSPSDGQSEHNAEKPSGVDIGGTFTDLVCYDEDSGQVSSFKVSTTPDDLSMGILAAIRHVALDPSDISLFVHGSTAGLNAFLEEGARTRRSSRPEGSGTLTR